MGFSNVTAVVQKHPIELLRSTVVFQRNVAPLEQRSLAAPLLYANRVLLRGNTVGDHFQIACACRRAEGYVNMCISRS